MGFPAPLCRWTNWPALAYSRTWSFLHMARVTFGTLFTTAALLLLSRTASAQSATGSAVDSIAVVSALDHFVGFVLPMATDSISRYFTADVELAANGKELVLRILLADVVDDLHRLDDAGA